MDLTFIALNTISAASAAKEEKAALKPEEILGKYGITGQFSLCAEKMEGEYFKESKKLVVVILEQHNFKDPPPEYVNLHKNELKILNLLLKNDVDILFNEGLPPKEFKPVWRTSKSGADSLIAGGKSATDVFMGINGDKLKIYGFEDIELTSEFLALNTLAFERQIEFNPQVEKSKSYQYHKAMLERTKKFPDEWEGYIQAKELAEKKYIHDVQGKKFVDIHSMQRRAREIIDERSEAEVRNVLRIMDVEKESKAVVVIGYGHKDKIKSELENKQVSYVLIHPKGLEKALWFHQ